MLAHRVKDVQVQVAAHIPLIEPNFSKNDPDVDQTIVAKRLLWRL